MLLVYPSLPGIWRTVLGHLPEGLLTPWSSLPTYVRHRKMPSCFVLKWKCLPTSHDFPWSRRSGFKSSSHSVVLALGRLLFISCPETQQDTDILRQWFSTFLTLQPVNMVPHIMVSGRRPGGGAGAGRCIFQTVRWFKTSQNHKKSKPLKPMAVPL